MGEDPKPQASSAYEFLKEWWTIIAPIAGAAASVLVGVGIEAPLATALGLPLALILAGVTAYMFHRKNKGVKNRQGAENRLEFSERAPKTAFRGLYSYGSGDVLPGEHRRHEALRIATQVESAEFMFGVVSGDIGVGKTSLLQSGVQPILERNGASVRFVRHPRDLLALAPLRAEGERWDERLRTALASLSDTRIGGSQLPSVLIIDQFEEFFAELAEASARQELGRFLRDPYPGGHVKVLCAVRHDYLLDMHDLAPSLTEPLSTKALFPIRNFTENQAAEVIKECARLDKLHLAPQLAATIATDLAVGGPVRPPELQVVCTALSDSPTLEHYRTAGGATGIISEYVKNAIALCASPALGRMLLRGLCDFEASPPIKARPQTVHELASTIGLSEELPASLTQIERSLGQFQTARLVLASPDGRGMLTFSLVHDYLVGPIGTATSEISTRTEQANQTLKLYLAQRQTDPRAVIPFRRYRFIKQNAAPDLLSTFRARQIMRASRRAYLLSASTFLSLLGAVTIVLVVGTLNTQAEAFREIVGRQSSVASGAFMDVRVSPTGRLIMTGSTKDSLVKFWNPISGDSLLALRGTIGDVGTNWFVTLTSAGTYELYEISTGRRHRTPFRSSEHRFVRLSTTDTTLTIFDAKPSYDTTTPWTATLRLWSPSTGVSAPISDVYPRDTYVASNGRRAVLWLTKDGLFKLVLWQFRASSTPDMTILAGDSVAGGSTALSMFDRPLEGFDVDEGKDRIVTCEVEHQNVLIHLWDLGSGTRLQTRSIAAEDIMKCDVWFNNAATAIILQATPSLQALADSSYKIGPKVVYVLDASNFMSVSQIPSTNATLVTEGQFDERSTYFAWEGEGGEVLFWDSDSLQSNPKVLQDVAFKDVTTFSIDPTGSFLLAHIIQARYVVWHVHSGERRITLGRGNRIKSATFALSGDALYVTDDGNMVSLYDLRIGKQIAWFNAVISNALHLTYDRQCERVHVWTHQGIVFRYSSGRRSPFWGFRPARDCSRSSQAALSVQR